MSEKLNGKKPSWMHNESEVKGIMADPSRRGRFPGSRDWAFESLTVRCGRITCAANHSKKCVMPSLLEIDSKGM